MPTPSWDLAITLFFLMGIAFGYILQRDKIVATLVSVYIALIVTQAFSGNLYQFFQGDKTLFNQVWIKSNTNPLTIRVLLFGLVIVLLSAKSGISAQKTKGLLSPLEIIVYSTLTTGLILASLFYFLPPESRETFAATSKMARLLINNYTWWVIMPVVAMVVFGFLKKDD
jgi:hypothetical protein